MLGKRKNYDKDLAVLVAYLSGTVFSFLILLIQGNFALPAVSQMPGYLYNGVFCNAMPYLLWAWALDHGNTAVIANLAYLAPFVFLLVTCIQAATEHRAECIMEVTIQIGHKFHTKMSACIHFCMKLWPMRLADPLHMSKKRSGPGISGGGSE